jgi:hypothetical protein
LGHEETVAGVVGKGSKEPIVLKNSFLAPIRNFAAPWSRQDKIDVGDQQVLRKIR